MLVTVTGWGAVLPEKLTGPQGSGRKEPRGRPRRRWEDNIKADLQEVG